MVMNSCSNDSNESEDSTSSTPEVLVTDYVYNQSELALIQLVNDYRLSIGLNALQEVNHISYQSSLHNEYMIANNVMNHNGFDKRAQNIMKFLNAKSVAENVAYEYSTSESAFNAWLVSSGHKANIEGDYTHFGIAVKADAKGKKYYTAIFAKI